MTVVLIVLIVLLAGALAVILAQRRPRQRPQPSRMPGEPARRILFPFVATALSRRALDAALRLARAEGATLVPVFLAKVPFNLPLDAPLPKQSQVAIALQEAIEHRALKCGVPVDARVERGRTERHALRETIAHERFDRIVVAAAPHGGQGFDPDDVAWLLDHAAGEIVVLRPDAEEGLPAPGLPPREQVPGRAPAPPAVAPRRPAPPPPVLSRAA